MSKDPWMPFYGDDFFEDRFVKRLSREWRCIYLELLWSAWNEGGIFADLEDLANSLEMSPAAFKKGWAKLAPLWEPHPTDPELLVNTRQEKVRDEQGKRRRQNQENARKRSQPAANSERNTSEVRSERRANFERNGSQLTSGMGANR